MENEKAYKVTFKGYDFICLTNSIQIEITSPEKSPLAPAGESTSQGFSGEVCLRRKKVISIALAIALSIMLLACERVFVPASDNFCYRYILGILAVLFHFQGDRDDTSDR